MTVSSVMVSWAVLERLAEPGRLASGSRGGRARPLQGAGSDPRSGLEALEAGDLVFELPDPFLLQVDLVFELLDAPLLEGDDIEQLLDQRRAIGLRDVGQWNPHGQIPPAIPRPICPGLLRSYREGIRNQLG